MKKPWKRVFFASASVLLALVAFEVVLQVLCRASARLEAALFSVDPYVPDARLRFRPNPRYPGHDAKGYRNASVPERVDIVAMGDSQTYGAGVESEAAWPRVLSKMSGRSVYNFAAPGYGLGQSLILLDDALSLSPKVVIEAFYSGNDLFDAFFLAYHQRSLEPLKSRDAGLIQTLERAEAVESLEHRAMETSGASPDKDLIAQATLWDFLGEHCALYALTRAVRRLGAHVRAAPSWESEKANALRCPGTFRILETAAARKVLTPSYRLLVLDQEDPRVAEGLRISLECLERMHSRLRAKGVELVVLFLPTAELVFEQAVRESGAAMPVEYARLLDCEKRMWNRTRELLSARSIRFVDALPALQDSLKRGEQPYPANSDGHPNEAGHAAIAQAVLDALASH